MVLNLEPWLTAVARNCTETGWLPEKLMSSNPIFALACVRLCSAVNVFPLDNSAV